MGNQASESAVPAVVILVAGTHATGFQDVLVPTAERLRSRLRGGAVVEVLRYPASGLILSREWPAFAVFGTSPREGVRALTRRLEELGSTAPGQCPVVPIGFSQGALVVTETLSRPEDRRFARSLPALSPSARRSVWAAVSIGNPAFRAGEPFNQGTPLPGVSGMLARPSGALDAMGDSILDVAEHDDVAAQHVRTATMAGHLEYGSRGYADRIADWVVNKVDERLSRSESTVG